MKTLASGTPKIILLDQRDIARNKERRKAGVPIVVVVETLPEGLRYHRAYDVLTLGTASLAYSQNDPLLRKVRLAPDLPDEDIHAALYTEGEMLLAEAHGEALVPPEIETAMITADDLPPPPAAEVPAPKKDKKQK